MSIAQRRRIIGQAGGSQKDHLRLLEQLQRSSTLTRNASDLPSTTESAVRGSSGGAIMETVVNEQAVPQPSYVEGYDAPELPEPDPSLEAPIVSAAPASGGIVLTWPAATNVTGDTQESLQVLDPATGIWSDLPLDGAAPAAVDDRYLVQPERTVESTYLEAGSEAGMATLVGFDSGDEFAVRVKVLDESYVGAALSPVVDGIVADPMEEGDLTLAPSGGSATFASWTSATGGVAPITGALIQQISGVESVAATSSPATVSSVGVTWFRVRWTDALGNTVQTPTQPPPDIGIG